MDIVSQPKPGTANDLLWVTLSRRNNNFLIKQESVLKDPSFSIEFIMTTLEANDSPDILGLKCELIRDLTDRHKVIDITSSLPMQ